MENLWANGDLCIRTLNGAHCAVPAYRPISGGSTNGQGEGVGHLTCQEIVLFRPEKKNSAYL